MLSKDELDQLRKIIREENDPLKQGQAHLQTAVEAVTAGLKEVQETMATKADVQDLNATLTKRVHDHEERISALENEVGIPHPHKH